MSEYPEIAARFARETARHELRVLHDDGVYRHLLFMPQQHSFYWFELITTPGQLVFSGDGESFTFRRVTDMFKFFRSGLMRDGSIEINPMYWSEKLTSDRDSVQKYQDDLFIKLVWEQANHLIEQEYVRPDQADRFRQAIKDDIVEGGLYTTADEAYRTVEEFEFYNDPSKEFDYRHQADVRFEEPWEWFNATKDFDRWFLWACHAIVWGIARYDRVRRYGLRKLATVQRDGVRFEEPASRALHGREARQECADALRDRPGDWALLGKYATSGSARQAAYCVRRAEDAQDLPFAPAGSFEAEARTMLGEHRVYVRYVGGGAA